MGAKKSSKYDGYFLNNQRFGKYIILDNNIIKDIKTHEAKIKCKCDCGNINIVSCITLVKGVSTGCFKCGHGKKGINHHSFKGYKEIPGSWFSRYSKNSKKYLNITIQDIYNLWIKQNKQCALSGLEIDFINTNTKTNRHKHDLICTASLDRIDSKKGYIIDNIQLVHKDVNMIKKEYDQNYFIKLCKLITLKQQT